MPPLQKKIIMLVTGFVPLIALWLYSLSIIEGGSIWLSPLSWVIIAWAVIWFFATAAVKTN